MMIAKISENETKSKGIMKALWSIKKGQSEWVIFPP